MRSLIALCGLLPMLRVIAVPLPQEDFTLHETIDTLPRGWTFTGEAANDTLVTLRAYFKQSNRDWLQVAGEVSDPLGSRYGRHMSAEELILAQPDTNLASDTVIAWLHRHSVQDYTIGRELIEFTVPVGQAGEMLDAQFASYSYQAEEPILRTQSYSLPAAVYPHIDFIYPTIHFFTLKTRPGPYIHRRQHVPTGLSNCSNSVCPAQLASQYHISYQPQDNKSGSKLGITGFLEYYPNITDVKSFLSQYGIDKKAAFPQYSVEVVNKGTTKIPIDSGALTVEAELDLDYSLAFTGPLDVSYYTVGGRGTQLSQPGNKTVSPSGNEPFLDFMQYILAQKAPPQVISISYSDDEQSVPQAYACRVCDLFAQAAARGISIIVASGDGGASGTGTDTVCKGPGGKRRFVPTFPASCPWVTSVGATASYGGTASFSSGGLSNYFGRPKWQDTNVTAYLQELNGTHKGLYNASGRGIPDVSLLGDDYLTLTGGYAATHDGTSASAPVFAAMITLINDARLRNKKPVLGFLNPLLYAAKAQTVYRDVSDGSTSIGCADGNFFEGGWEALEGWDAATGLGEPDFEKLRALLA